MKPIIKRTKHADIVEYQGKEINLSANIKRKFIVIYSLKFGVNLTLPEAKELAEVLPKFLEEMEK